jgi:hypothetical protein
MNEKIDHRHCRSAIYHSIPTVVEGSNRRKARVRDYNLAKVSLLTGRSLASSDVCVSSMRRELKNNEPKNTQERLSVYM